MAESFYNPYQFIPVTGKVNGEDTSTEPFARIKSGESDRSIRHDLWDGKRKSGRIVCSLTLETPTVVGNQHEPLPSGETLVKPYQFPDGEYAIPANSLRGMVSSTAEALSQSALRVLEEKRYSVRKEREIALSAIGMIQSQQDPETKEESFYILPLTLPTIRLEAQGKIPDDWIKVFQNRTLSSCLGAYVNGYKEYPNNQLRYQPSSFLLSNHSSFHENRPIYYWARPSGALNGKVSKEVNLHRLQELYINNNMVLGQNIDAPPLTNEKFMRYFPDPAQQKQSGYIRGVLYVLGIEFRDKSLPAHEKKHERFVPFPELTDRPTLLEIKPEALENFKRMSKECANASKKETIPEKKRPFLPQGYVTAKDPAEYWKPTAGELIYFNIDSDGQVIEISYSSIWRKSVDGSIHGAFKKINRNLLPWGSKDREGQKEKEDDGLTPAEWLFGVVEGGEKKDKSTRSPKSLNLASRVRFFDARSLEPIEVGAEIPLKILSSPKPPSPAMYFKTGPLKKDLSMDIHAPNGRKYYLPHSKAHASSEPWITQNKKDNLDQKCRCTPLPAGASFYFHIDFDNLSDAELELLLKSIKPAEGFRHRLGLGKPLGLGSVTTDIHGVFYIDRAKRYSTEEWAGTAGRYAEVSHQDKWNPALAEWYPAEHGTIAQGLPGRQLTPEENLIDHETLEILKILGADPEPRNPNAEVRYPIAEGQENSETDGFKWFANNDDKRNARQILEPVEIGQPLPALKPNTEFNRGR